MKEKSLFQNKLNKLERLVETQGFNRLNRKDFEKRSNKSFNSTEFRSNFYFSSEKYSYLSESQKNMMIKLQIKNTEIQIKQYSIYVSNY